MSAVIGREHSATPDLLALREADDSGARSSSSSEKILGFDTDGLPDNVCPAFLARLERERELSDRSGHGFCVAVARATQGTEGRTRLLEFYRQASKGLRQTDHVAVLNDDNVGVLFPFSTRHQGLQAPQRLKLDSMAPNELELSVEAHLPLPPAEGLTRESRRVSIVDIPRPPSGAGLDWDPRGVSFLLSGELPRWKRATDILLAGTTLLLLSPLMGLIALLVKLTSPGPAIYKQWRTGNRFKPFLIYKFRTMRRDADRELETLQSINLMSGPLFKSEEDPRVLRLGKLLRKTSLDELPQLFNVLRGDMTLIGPRALSPKPKDYEPWQLRRFDVKPGLACDWQARRRAETDFDEWMRSDLGYVDSAVSPRRDVGLLLRTALSVLRCAGSR